jgi:NAD(P)-dependent dehydrogenase (short-subunit alcohol dehydrogenase family)
MGEQHSLQGKVIAVTGGASGIGLAIARKLEKCKAKVAIADISAAPTEFDGNSDVLFTRVDVSSRTEVHQWIQGIVSKFGRLDGMCANAGISPFEGGIVADDLYRRIFAVCADGVWHCGTEAYKQFERQNSPGVICNTASGAGLRGMRGQAAYVGAKHAVVGFTKAWALDWASKGIRVNALSPGMYVQ